MQAFGLRVDSGQIKLTTAVCTDFAIAANYGVDALAAAFPDDVSLLHRILKQRMSRQLNRLIL
jgi:hypothetical protein